MGRRRSVRSRRRLFARRRQAVQGRAPMTNAGQDGIERRLSEAFNPVELRVKDQSHLHAGHAGAQDGRGHFDVYIVAPVFEGLTPLKRHQLIYGALGTLLQTDVHAVRIRALAPHEVQSNASE